MTCILHLHLATSNQQAADDYLGSARRELLSLVAICASTDTQKTAAYLHWLVYSKTASKVLLTKNSRTLLFYPLTAYFAIFCNAVATCHTEDFQILKDLANCLAESGAISQPIAAMHGFFQQLVSLSWCFLGEENAKISATEDQRVVQPESSCHQSHHRGTIDGNFSPLSLSWVESALNQETLNTASETNF